MAQQLQWCLRAKEVQHVEVIAGASHLLAHTHKVIFMLLSTMTWMLLVEVWTIVNTDKMENKEKETVIHVVCFTV